MIIKVHTVLAAQAGHDCGSEDMTGRVRLIVCTRGDCRIDSEGNLSAYGLLFGVRPCGKGIFAAKLVNREGDYFR